MPLREHHVLAALAGRRFRRLFAVRMAGQYGDGVFQASLAGAVLFDPQRAGRASDIAIAFAVLLLPYSLLGPFAGVLIDRWWRRGVLIRANAVRAGLVLLVAAEIAAGAPDLVFYACALVVISISRFVLATLSAALPRTVDEPQLVTANALTSTVGTVCAALGGGTAIVIRSLFGSTNGDYAAIAALALLPYLAAATLAAGSFTRMELGPSAEERRSRESVQDVVRGLRAGVRTVRATAPVGNALAMLGVHRVLYGTWLVSTVLLYRDYFSSDGVLRAGLGGLSQVIAGIALGGAIASVITPVAFRTFGAVRWPGFLLAFSGLAELALVLPYTKLTLLASALALSIAAQGIKISVDTLVQNHIPDDFRGRVFSIYDMLFNVAAVLAAAWTALALPESGHSQLSVFVLAGGWVLTALSYRQASKRTGRHPASGDQFSVRSLG